MNHPDSRMAIDWPFYEPRNCPSFTMRQVLEGIEPILLVVHDDDDHTWQFIGSTDAAMKDARVVCLEHMVAQDPTILQVADLPSGWEAFRRSPKDPWERRKSSAEEE